MLRRAIFVLPATAGLFSIVPVTSSPAFYRMPSIASSIATMPPSAGSATGSRTCSRASKAGGAHTRYDRCAHTFLSAIAFAATFIFWINES